MVYKVVTSAKAQGHLAIIEEWLLAQATEGIKVKQWIQQLREAINSLKEWPFRCPLIDRPKFPVGTRALYFGDYIVFYRVQKEVVRVLGVTGPGQQCFAKCRSN